MSNDTHRLDVEVRVTQRTHGALRSITVLDEDSQAAFVDTQEWRLETLSVESYVRDTFNIPNLNETSVVGYIDVNADTLEWVFTPTNDEIVS